jgi:hypothetical protein
VKLSCNYGDYFVGTNSASSPFSQGRRSIMSPAS